MSDIDIVISTQQGFWYFGRGGSDFDVSNDQYAEAKRYPSVEAAREECERLKAAGWPDARVWVSARG